MVLWKERVKDILGLPPEAKVVTKPYYRNIIKKNGKVYRALTIQYVQNGRRRYKHIPKSKEPLVLAALIEDLKEDRLKEFARELKMVLEDLERNPKDADGLRKDLFLLLTSLLT